MKHIYIFNNASRAAQYGIGTYTKQMIRCLKEVSGVRITLINLNAEQTEVVEEKSEEIRSIQIPVIKYTGTENDYHRYYRNLMYVLAPYIRTEETNVFYLNYLHSRPVVPLLRKLFPGCRILLTVHYINWCFTLKGNTSLFHRILAKDEDTRSEEEAEVCQDYENDRNLFKEVDQVVCLSEYTRQLLHNTYATPKEKMTLIYNGLEDEAVLLPAKEKVMKKQALLFDREDKIILFVGRLDEIKGLDYLLKAFRSVLKEVPKTRLLIVGDGNFNTYLEKATDLAGRITYIGKVEKEKLYEYYQIATVGVMPSFHEQCSYVGIEMMMHGIPLIGTDSTGLDEMIEDSYKAHINETDKTNIDTEELSRLLIAVLHSSDNHLGRLYRKRYDKYYSLSAMKRKYQQLLGV